MNNSKVRVLRNRIVEVGNSKTNESSSQSVTTLNSPQKLQDTNEEMAGVTTRKRSRLTSHKSTDKLETIEKDANTCERIVKVQLNRDTSVVKDSSSRRVTRTLKVPEVLDENVDSPRSEAVVEDPAEDSGGKSTSFISPVMNGIGLDNVGTTEDVNNVDSENTTDLIDNCKNNSVESLQQSITNDKPKYINESRESDCNEDLNVENPFQLKLNFTDKEVMDEMGVNPNKIIDNADSPSDEVSSRDTSLFESTLVEEDINVLSKVQANSSNFKKSLDFHVQKEFAEKSSSKLVCQEKEDCSRLCKNSEKFSAVEDLGSTEKCSSLSSTEKSSPSKCSNVGQESPRKGAECNLIEVTVDVTSKTDEEQQIPLKSITSPKKTISHRADKSKVVLGSKDAIVEVPKVSDLEVNLQGSALSPQKKDIYVAPSLEKLEDSSEIIHPKSNSSHQKATFIEHESDERIESSCKFKDMGSTELPSVSFEGTSKSNNSSSYKKSRLTQFSSKDNKVDRIVSESPPPTEIELLGSRQQESDQSPQSSKLNILQQKYRLGTQKKSASQTSNSIASTMKSSELALNSEANSETEYIRISKNELSQLIREAVNDAFGGLISEIKKDIVELKASKRKMKDIEVPECVSLAEGENEYSAPIKKKKEETIELLLAQRCAHIFSDNEKKKKKKKRKKKRDKPLQLADNFNLEKKNLKKEISNLEPTDEPAIHVGKSKKQKILKIGEETLNANEGIEENQEELNIASKKKKNKVDSTVNESQQLYDISSHVKKFGYPTFEKYSTLQDDDVDSMIKSKKKRLKKKNTQIEENQELNLASKKKSNIEDSTVNETQQLYDINAHVKQFGYPTFEKYSILQDDVDSMIKSKKKPSEHPVAKKNFDKINKSQKASPKNTSLSPLSNALCRKLLKIKKNKLRKRDKLESKSNVVDEDNCPKGDSIARDTNKLHRPTSSNKSKGAKSHSPNTFRENLIKKKLEKIKENTEDYRLTLNEDIIFTWD